MNIQCMEAKHLVAGLEILIGGDWRQIIKVEDDWAFIGTTPNKLVHTEGDASPWVLAPEAWRRVKH